jgi:periplasmic copper chaperone A
MQPVLNNSTSHPRKKDAKMKLSLTVRSFSLVVMLMAVLVACTPVQAPAMTEAMPEPEPGQVTVMNPRARPAMQGQNGAAYMTILNGLDAPVQVIEAQTEVAGIIELHETVRDGDIMRMVPQPDGFAVPAGGSVVLEPGGKHVMLIGLVNGLEVGSEFDLTLVFDNGETMALTVPVVDMAAAMGGMQHGAMDAGDMDEAEMEEPAEGEGAGD